MINLPQEYIDRIDRIYDIYFNTIRIYSFSDMQYNRYRFLVKCLKRAEAQERHPVIYSIVHFFRKLNNSSEFQRDEECDRAYAICCKGVDEYPDVEIAKPTNKYTYTYKPADKYIETAKARVCNILNE